MNLKSQRINLGNGINLNLIKTDKFKSNLLSYYFVRPLSEEEVTKNALLPLVLKRGTENHDNNLEIQKYLEENYGSQLSMGINKRGEKHILRFAIQVVDKNYVEDEEYIYNMLEFLQSIIFNPVLEKGYFKKDYVEQEKENLKRRIQGRINNKRAYALDRCIEEMCKNEKFSIYSLGNIEDLEDINNKVLYDHYKEVINTSPMEIFYTGNYHEKLINNLKKEVNIKRENLINIPKTNIIKSVQTKNMVQEEMDVVQGKVALGLRTGIAYDDKLYYGLLLASDILGGGPNSKLFKKLREKESLAYYINSSVYKYKSLMLIDGGIEFDDFEKTIDIISKELEDMKKGLFTDKDIELSKKSLKSSMESVKDSIYLITEFFFSQQLSGDSRSLEDILKDLENVKREEIIQAISGVSLDTIYFMKNTKLDK